MKSKGEITMALVITFLIGEAAGSIITFLLRRGEHIGSLIVDDSEQNESPMLFLEVARSKIGKLNKKKGYVSFRIVRKSVSAHK